MIVKAHMSAFGSKNDIREITIPDEEIASRKTIMDTLALVFKYGQNEKQPMDKPSVSAWDVINLKGKYYICRGVGWKEISEAEFKDLPDNMKTKYSLQNKMYDE